MRFASRRHGTVELGRELARGGEGAVYEMTGRTNLVAKIYHTPLPPERARKIEAMTALRPVAYCAWPRDVVIDSSGRTRGFLMEKISGREEIHNVISPKARQQKFPNADYRFIVTVAANLARAIANVHAAGHVVGDINERFAMVGSDATVVLIDCDSFQISSSGFIFFCDVATPHYQPPELQRVASYKGLKRIRNHDCFGLAVLIFQLLFLGRHPFAGQPVSGDAPTLEEAIGNFLFPYGREAQTKLRPPPHAMPLESVTPRMQEYFRIAFGPRGKEQGRPTAKAWVRALEEFARNLQRCSVNFSHWHMPGQCFICALERASGTSLFIPSAGVSSAWVSRAAELWRRILAVPEPTGWGDPPGPPVASPPSESARSPAAGIAAGAIVLLFFAMPDLAVVWLAGLVVVGLYYGYVSNRVAEARVAFDDAMKRYLDLCETWRQRDPAQRHRMLVQSLEPVANQLKILQKRREDALKRIAAQSYEAALRQYLDHFTLRPGEIPGIGPTLVATLRSFGIDSAADCELPRLPRVPGIGPVRAKRLVDWRKSKERTFRPPPTVKPDPREIARVESDYARQAYPLLRRLEHGHETLRSLPAISVREKQDLLLQLRAAGEELAKAAARLREVT